ncbi:MAG TPA: FtsW/RodA/SpoVE family cell cycle protein, partial [Oscillospiraceae bacterium]|nr:FtsW/RodA/SpoVE family cell cycle protein [Oscillospiraceae bacterium]
MKAVLSLIWQYFKKLDKQLYLAVLILGLFSVVLLYSIVQNGIIASVSPRTYKIQFISLILGSICALVLSGIDYKMIAKLWFLYVPAALILVLLLFSPLGIQREGVDDIGWLDIGFTTVQPSEFLKIAFILSFSYHLSKVYEHINRLSTVALLCLHGAFPVLLIGVTGDTGTAIVFFVIFAAMLFSAGISWKYILAALISAPLAGLFLWFKILKPVHKKRILILFDNDLDPDMFQQQRQGKIALGSGQLFGKGLFGGEYSYVP